MNEQRNGFSLRTLILQILLIMLFVFILIWLFPTKSYMDDKFVTEDELIQRLQSIYGRNFADNIESMRDAAKDYFTKERLPEKVGDSVTLTLGEMVNKKLVLDFKDSNGNKCNAKESYVKLTRLENEYQLKVQLSCSDYTDYIVDYIGCYEYCPDCNKTVVKTTTTKVVNTNTTKTETKQGEVTPTPVVKNYRYQYRLTTQNTYSNWSDWSAWSTTPVTSNTLTQVEIDKRQVSDGYNQVWGITGYKTETYTDYETQTYTDYETQTYTEYETQTYTDYETKTEKYVTGSSKQLVSSVAVTTSNGYYTDWVSAGTKTTKDQVLYTTNTTRYTLTGTDRQLDCNNSCKYVTIRYYKVETRSWVAGTSSCPSGYTLENGVCNKYETVNTYGYRTVKVPVTKTRQVPVTKTRQVPVTKTRKVAVTKTRQVPVYGYINGTEKTKVVTYYRYRTRTQLTTAGVTYAWGNSTNDTTLTQKGYVYTGYYEEV